jgi:microcystin-dependent protein
VTKYRTFSPGDEFPSDWANALAEFLGSSFHNFQVIIKPSDPTVLQVPAGPDNAQVAIAINGRWRFNTATVERASLGGTARAMDVHVTAADNSFAPSGEGETDNTNYTFALAITESGVLPTGAALSRKVYSAFWSGTRFLVVKGLLPVVPDDASVTGGPAGPGVKIAGQTITADNLVQALAGQLAYPGDYKFSEQTADHGINGTGAAWLLVSASRRVNAATYPALWAAMGSPAVDGSNTFALPALPSRALVAAGAGVGLTARTAGQTGGQEKVTLDNTMIPAHSHPTTDPQHSHGPTAGFIGYIEASGSPQSFGLAGPTGAPVQVGGPSNTGSAATGVTVGNNTGGGSSHENMPPWLAKSAFIKT